jgi:hypothetical protein
MKYQSRARNRVLAALLILGVFCIAGIVATAYFAPQLLVYVKKLTTATVNPALQASQTSETDDESAQTVVTTKEVLFVPYWQLTSDNQMTGDLSPMDFPESQTDVRLVYFSVAVDSEGLDTDFEGYRSMDTFLSQAPDGHDKYMAVSMLDIDTNYEVLEDSQLQKKIIEQSISLAREKGFEGVVLDLEMPPLLSDKVPKAISEFISQFGADMKKAKLHSAVTLFGDTFFRIRPYDVRSIGAAVDEVMVMAYDFHKAGGEPGPNFPFEGRETYSYDFQQMITDYLVDVGRQKLTIVYGMYGYDWIVDIEKRPLKAATATTLRQIERDYIDRCDHINCNQTRDPQTQEMQIEFVDDQSQYHIIWYEDRQSATRKTDYINSQGIESIGYWTYGYF